MAEEKKEIIRRRLQEEILQEIDYARQMSDDQMLSIIDDKVLPASLAAGLTLREKIFLSRPGEPCVELGKLCPCGAPVLCHHHDKIAGI